MRREQARTKILGNSIHGGRKSGKRYGDFHRKKGMKIFQLWVSESLVLSLANKDYGERIKLGRNDKKFGFLD